MNKNKFKYIKFLTLPFQNKNRNIPSALAIGVFDGVHKGHQYLLTSLVRNREKNNLAAGLITFWPHPRSFITSNFAGHLTSLYYRSFLLSKYGLKENIYVLSSNKNLFQISGEEFIKYLKEKFNFKLLVVGEDFKLGYKGKWKVKDLYRLQVIYGYKLVVVQKRKLNKEKISSSQIRNLIANREFSLAYKLLGHPYIFEGVVKQGKGKGRLLGFPTANLENNLGMVVPANGIYFSLAIVDNKIFPGAVNIGFAPTVKKLKKVQIEVHFLGYQGNCLGKKVNLIFCRYLREEKKFSSIEKLKKAISYDLARVKKEYKKNNKKITQLINWLKDYNKFLKKNIF